MIPSPNGCQDKLVCIHEAADLESFEVSIGPFLRLEIILYWIHIRTVGYQNIVDVRKLSLNLFAHLLGLLGSWVVSFIPRSLCGHHGKLSDNARLRACLPTFRRD
jgi:hypothetical protein